MKIDNLPEELEEAFAAWICQNEQYFSEFIADSGIDTRGYSGAYFAIDAKNENDITEGIKLVCNPHRYESAESNTN
jgi:hypothetical protein